MELNSYFCPALNDKQTIMNSIPTVTKNLLIINVLAFFGMIVAEKYDIDLNYWLGLHFVLSEDFNAAQLITYMFMHGGWTHIFFNMFAVWMFGSVLEQVWGPKRFLFYYLVCGIGAGLVQELVTGIRYYDMLPSVPPEMVDLAMREGGSVIKDGMNYSHPVLGAFNALLNGTTVGASGAVYAILLAFGMLFPNQQMFIMFLPIPIKAKYIVIGYALIELYSGFINSPMDNVAHFAHLGGMVFGFILIMYWRRRNRRNGFYYN